MRRNDESNVGYLYRHVRLDTNEVFYIGVGVEEQGKTPKSRFPRAYEKQARNQFWKSIVSKTDYQVEIIYHGLTYKEALNKERYFIELYGRRDSNREGATLCNLTAGGQGKLGQVVATSTRKKISDFATKNGTFFAIIDPNNNLVTGRNLHDYSLKHNLDPYKLRHVATGRSRSSQGYTSAYPYVSEPPQFLMSPTGERVEFLNHRTFSKENNLCFKKVSAVLTGARIHHRGWHLPNPPLEHIKILNNFHNRNSVYIVTESNKIHHILNFIKFCKRYNISPPSLRNFMRGQSIKFLIERGWRLPTPDDFATLEIVIED